MYSAKQIYLGGRGRVWRNPYITDGLLAMWDGEWNVGGGVHDPSATVWKDLVGTRDATLSGTYSWGSNYWYVHSVYGRGLATWDGTNLPTSQTIEIALHTDNYVGYGRMMAEAHGIPSPCYDIQGTVNVVRMYGYGIDAGATIQGLNVLDSHSYSIAHPSGGPLTWYVDGSDVWTRATGNDSLGATNGYFANNSSYSRGIDSKYHCIRIYSRALTADEIAANYAIDKARFDLP